MANIARRIPRIVPRHAPTPFPFARFKSGRDTSPQYVTLQQPAQQSHRLLVKEGSGSLPGDLGLMQDTFIMPIRKNRPSIISSPSQRFNLVVRHTVRRVLDWKDKIIFRVMSKQKLRLREPKKIAPRLYEEMYTAYAHGDVEKLRMICGDGLLETFKRRLMARGRNRVEWKLHKYISPVRMVSHKAHFYGTGGIDLCRRQAVLRMHTLQSLTKYSPQGKPIEGSGKPKEVLEYLVVETKSKKQHDSQSWFIWGTTEESGAS